MYIHKCINFVWYKSECEYTYIHIYEYRIYMSISTFAVAVDICMYIHKYAVFVTQVFT